MFSLFTFQMLFPFLVSPPKIPYPLPPPHASQPTHSHSWSWYSPILGHAIFERPRASPPIDGRLGHPLLHMQIEKRQHVISVETETAIRRIELKSQK